MHEILTAFGINWKLLLIQAINFGILLFLLQRFLYQPILRIIDERKVKIEKGVQNANEAEQKLEQAEESAKNLLSEANKKADILTEETYQLLRKLKEEKAMEAEEQGRKILVAAEKERAMVHEKALRDAKEDIIQISMLAAEKILKEKKV